MRAALLTCVLLVSVLQLSAQQTSTTHPTVSSVLDRINSASRTEREKAFGEAGELLGSDAISPRDADRLRLGIIQLLVRENNEGLKERDEVKQASPAPSAGEVQEEEGEEDSDYYSGLIGFVANLNDERAIPALLGAANTGGIATRGVARFGKRALDATLMQAKNANPDLAEGALWVIRDMLEFGLVSDPESLQRIKSAIRSALDAPDVGLRDTGVYLVGYLDKREEFVPKLKDIAEHDPAKLPNQPKDDGTVGDFYFVRVNAARVLEQIANHVQPPIDRGLPPSEYEPVKP